jgi:hypothetical protein
MVPEIRNNAMAKSFTFLEYIYLLFCTLIKIKNLFIFHLQVQLNCYNKNIVQKFNEVNLMMIKH